MDQLVDHLARGGTTINVVPEVNLDRAINWIRFQMFIDPASYLFQKIGPTVDVAHSINTRTVGQSGFDFAREQSAKHWTANFRVLESFYRSNQEADNPGFSVRRM